MLCKNESAVPTAAAAAAAGVAEAAAAGPSPMAPVQGPKRQGGLLVYVW